MRRTPTIPLLALLALLSGCATARRVGWAAWDAAASPEVLIPAAGAAVFQADRWDRKVSNWASERTPVFGSRSAARTGSDILNNASLAVAGVAALAVPTAPDGSWTPETKALDFGGGAAAVGATVGITEALQHGTARKRPNGERNTSFPSSHASSAAAANALTERYVEHLPVPEWAKWTMDGALFGASCATGWARVEARKHFPSDVLAGIALGAFAGRFANALLEPDGREAVQVSAAPADGGVLFSIAVRW